MAYDDFIPGGSTGRMIEVFARSATTGQGLTGLAFGSVTAYYMRQGAAARVSISVVTATLGAFTSGGWVEVGGGWYQFGVPNAALVAGVDAVSLLFSASGMIDIQRRILLTTSNLRISTPAVAPGALNGLPLGDASGRVLLQLTQTGVTIPTVTTVTDYTAPLDSTATQAAAAAALSAYDPPTRTEATADKAEVLTAVNGLPTAAEIDAELSGTHGAGDWGPGGSSGEFVRTFTVRDSSTLQGIRNALVTLRASDQVTRVDQKASIASGVAAFNLDTGTYYYQVSATGYQAVTLTELTVAADGSTVVPLTALPATEVAAGTRVVRYILVTPDGATPEGVVVSAKLRAATRASIPLALVQRQTLTTTTDANGVADLVCITADQFAEGDGEYVFSASGVPDITTAIPPGSGALNVQTHTAV